MFDMAHPSRGLLLDSDASLGCCIHMQCRILCGPAAFLAQVYIDKTHEFTEHTLMLFVVKEFILDFCISKQRCFGEKYINITKKVPDTPSL